MNGDERRERERCDRTDTFRTSKQFLDERLIDTHRFNAFVSLALPFFVHPLFYRSIVDLVSFVCIHAQLTIVRTRKRRLQRQLSR